MKEIGGYLELETFVNNEYYNNAIALNSARNALVYLAKAKNISKIYIPYYLCDSVWKVCEREKISYSFYNIGTDFTPVFDKVLEKNEYIYIVNYFGQTDCEDLKAYKEKYRNVIIDNVQAFFSSTIEGVDAIYSCRKFFGVPDGAYLISDAAGIEMEEDVSKDRMKHLLGRLEGTASEYYADFQDNDLKFEQLPLMHMSKLTHNLLGAIDYNQIQTIRNRNWDFLNEALKEKNLLTLKKNSAPYMYSFYCENGNSVRKKMISHNIYIPALWPNVLDFDGCETEKDFTQNILPLPVDQRYTIEDMKFMLEILNECI